MTVWSEASTDVINTAIKIVREFHPDLEEASIGFLFRDTAQESMGKRTLGKASKVTDRLKPYLDYDFIIWIAEDAWTDLEDNQRKALLDHELCHCTMDEGTARMVHHDIEEFQAVIERHGIWHSELAAFAYAITLSPQMQLALEIEAAKKDGRIEAIKNSLIHQAAEVSGDRRHC
jgi:hypothetical protein